MITENLLFECGQSTRNEFHKYGFNGCDSTTNPESEIASEFGSKFRFEEDGITNDEFLASIFGRRFSDAFPLVCHKPGDPDAGGWSARPWPCATQNTGLNWYCLPALFRTEDSGRYRAVKDLAVAIHALMLDDIGTKVKPDSLDGITPTWSIETSPGNHQWGFIVYPPVKDMRRLEALKTTLIKRGLCDPGATGVGTRWMRLPNGINGRPKYGTPAYQCRLVQWNPLLRFSLEKLEQMLGLSEGYAARTEAMGMRHEIAPTQERVIQQLKTLGLYKKQLGTGKHDITCPWVDEHTDKVDNGAAYFEPSQEYPNGGFRCHHSHGDRVQIKDLLAYIESKDHVSHVLKTREWPEPERLPSQLLPVPELNPELLPEKIRAGVVDIAERLGCPLDYIAIPTLVGAGIVIGNRVGILPKQYDESWRVFPGFWGGIVGEPGAMKTPALNAAFHPIYELERLEVDNYKLALAQYHNDKKIYEKSINDFKQGKAVNIGAEPIEPTKPRLIVNDSTYQALGEILAANPKGVMALADELSGLLQSLDTPGQEAARGFYLSGWGGTGNYTFDRVTRGTVCLTNYMLSVFGGFQPAKIAGYVQAAQGRNSKNDGLLQRFQLLVWPDVSDINVGVDRPENKTALQEMCGAVKYLRGIEGNHACTERGGLKGPVLLHFDTGGQRLFNEWFGGHESTLRKSDWDSSLNSHFSKYRSLVPGLALLFHLLDGNTGAVKESPLSAAIKFADYLKAHAFRVYASVNRTDQAPTIALAKRLLSGELQNGFTLRSIYTKGWRSLGDPERARSAVEMLLELSWLSESAVATGGRMKTTYQINPGISAELL